MASQAQSANRRTFRILHASGGSSFWNHVYSTIPLVTVPVCQLKPNNIALTVDVDDIGSETWRVNCNDTCCPHQPRLIIYLGVRMGRCYKFQLEVGFVVLNSFLTSSDQFFPPRPIRWANIPITSSSIPKIWVSTCWHSLGDLELQVVSGFTSESYFSPWSSWPEKKIRYPSASCSKFFSWIFFAYLSMY